MSVSPDFLPPHFLPSLSAGAHDPATGEACVMEYVSLLAGEPWTDRPECTHPLLAHEARTTNDLLTDRDRPRLVPLIGRLFGTGEDSPAIRAALRLAQARRVSRLLDPGARARVEAAIASPPSDPIAAAVAFPVADGDLDPQHRDHHVQQSRVFLFALTPDLEADEAQSLFVLTVAHRVAAGECRADCASGPSRARRMVQDLAALLDTYDQVTGRVAPQLSPETVRELAAQV